MRDEALIGPAYMQQESRRGREEDSRFDHMNTNSISVEPTQAKSTNLPRILIELLMPSLGIHLEFSPAVVTSHQGYSAGHRATVYQQDYPLGNHEDTCCRGRGPRAYHKWRVHRPVMAPRAQKLCTLFARGVAATDTRPSRAHTATRDPHFLSLGQA